MENRRMCFFWQRTVSKRTNMFFKTAPVVIKTVPVVIPDDRVSDQDSDDDQPGANNQPAAIKNAVHEHLVKWMNNGDNYKDMQGQVGSCVLKDHTSYQIIQQRVRQKHEQKLISGCI
jgi:hypothetical protein